MQGGIKRRQCRPKMWMLAILWLLPFAGLCTVYPVFALDLQRQEGPACETSPQSMPLTPNSKSVATSLHDINDDTIIALQIQGQTYWLTLLSASNIVIVLATDRGSENVIFHKGLTLHFQANGPAEYQILLDGEITDDGTAYNIVGKLIAIFHPEVAACNPAAARGRSLH